MEMGNLNNKLMDKFFKKVDNVVWDMMTGRIGVMTEDGITSIEGEGDDAQITVNLFDNFGMVVPAFAQSTPVKDVAVGDLIYTNGKVRGWIISVNRVDPANDKSEVKSFSIMSPGGTTTPWKPPKVSMLGFESGVLVLRSLMNMIPGGQAGLGNMQGMLMPLMMMGGDVDLDSIMPIMLMGALGTNGDGSNASAGGMGNMMQMMMLMQLMGNKGSGNKGPAPFSSKQHSSGKGHFD